MKSLCALSIVLSGLVVSSPVSAQTPFYGGGAGIGKALRAVLLDCRLIAGNPASRRTPPRVVFS